MSTDAEDTPPGTGGDHPVHDSDAGLQEELRREAAERAALGGDTSMNRNLTGSSTWITLGEASETAPADQPDAPDGRGAGAP
jgi:hypothetical protein